MSEKSQLEQDLLEQHCRGMIDQIQQLLPRDALVDGQADNCTVAAVDGRDALDNLLLSIIDASVSNMADSSSWHVELNIVPSQRWVYFRNDRATIREQGWKLHISASVWSAEAVLQQALPVLLAEDANFKVAASLHWLTVLNSGLKGLSQVGKFITVYPNDDTQAVRLAVGLEKATRGLRGPAVLSDRPLTPDSLVYYRYGSFSARVVHSLTGKVTRALSSPSGELISDLCLTSYHKPDWAVDPFIAAGVAVEVKESSLLIGGRYLIASLLHESPRGAVFLAVDMATPCLCVLKQARRDALLNFEGRDARDNLRHEAEILAHLAPDPRFPTVFDLIEHDGDLFLAMEEMEGETLEQHVAIKVGQGSLIPTRQLIAWGRELAAMLETVHTKGFIYRDLKPTNVIVAPDGTLRLIDFGHALQLGDNDAASRGGTWGYMSPQQSVGEPTSITDDIYSLGALLYFAATRADASGAPHPFDLLNRPLTLLNPALGQSLEQVISRCLAHNPHARFPSMSALTTALIATSTIAPTTSSSFGTEPTPDAEEAARCHYRELARRLGETLCQTAQRGTEGRGLSWLSTFEFDPGIRLRHIYAGNSGPVLALAALVTEFSDPRHRAVLAESAHWLVEEPLSEGQLLLGLYTGEAGVGSALLRAGQILGDDKLIVAAVERGRWIASQPYISQDLMSGAAGRLRFHLLLWDETNELEHLRNAIKAGEWLVAVAEDARDGGFLWTLPPVCGGQTYVGYAHGAAGIADALLDLFEATGQEQFLAVAQGAGRWLECLAVPALDKEGGVNWPIVAGESPIGAFWCHGAAGIGKFFLHASELGLTQQAADLAAQAALTVARCSRWAGPTQCHGLSGNIEFLLDMFQATGNRAYYAEVRSLSCLLEAFAVERNGLLFWPSDAPTTISPDYMVGYAGVAVCLLRLANPTCLPHQLSRRGFHHRPASSVVGI